MSVNHQKWAPKLLKALILHVIGRSAGKLQITYGDLAKKIKYPKPHSGHGFSTNIGNTLRDVGYLLENNLVDGEEIPLIQAAVVSQAEKVPGVGFKTFSPNYDKLPKSKKETLLFLEYVRIEQFGLRWYSVLEVLKLDLNKREKTQRDKRYGRSNIWGSEGGPEHRALRDYVAMNPSVIGIHGTIKAHLEYPLESNDRVDVVLESSNYLYAIEVKAQAADDRELSRGLFQTIKYKALLKAEQLLAEEPKRVRSFLVIGGTLSQALRRKQHTLGIKAIEGIIPPQDFLHSK